MTPAHRQLLAAAHRVAKARARLAVATAKVKGPGATVATWRVVDRARVATARAEAALVVAALTYADGAK